MPHVFAETNWLVDCCAPAHNRVPAALELLARAGRGEIALYVPSVCLQEARRPLQTKFQTRLEADRMRRYVAWGLREQSVSQEEAAVVRRIVDQMENAVRTDLARIENRLREIAYSPGVEVVAYDEEMMRRAVDLGFVLPEVKPYDQSILATVLVRAERLFAEGTREMYFCERDSDLQPWDKRGDPLPLLTNLYDVANVWVCSDYLLENPPVPSGWHNRAR